jgi:hypothetical protein
VESYLKDAVAAYKASDLDGVIEALEYASSVESEHGDDPASSWLMDALIDDLDEEDEE